VTRVDSALQEALWADLPGALFISTSILVLFATAEAIKRLRKTPTEWTRKLTHVGGGVIVFGVPWMLQSIWTVVALCLAFAGILIGGRLTGWLSSVHDVERKTSGAYYYPFAVLGLYVLADGDPVLYCIPLVVMAVADTGAALVGKHQGQIRYKVLDGDRSLEGSFTFFGLAFMIVLVGLAIAGRPGWPAMLLVTLVVATLTTTVEAVSVRGSDNLLIPYVAWLALDRTLSLGLAGLGPWIEGMLFTLVLLLITARRADFTVAGGVTIFLIGSLAWALGGIAWWLPPTAVYLLFLVARLPQVNTDLDDVFATGSGPLAMVLAFAHTGDTALYAPFLVTNAATAAILMGFIARSRRWPLIPAAMVGTLVPTIPDLLLGHNPPVLITVAGGLSGLLIFVAIHKAPFPGRRLVASLVTGLGAWLVLG
jgi:phytol kinase